MQTLKTLLSHLPQMAVAHFQMAPLKNKTYGFLVVQHMILLIDKVELINNEKKQMKSLNSVLPMLENPYLQN